MIKDNVCITTSAFRWESSYTSSRRSLLVVFFFSQIEKQRHRVGKSFAQDYPAINDGLLEPVYLWSLPHCRPTALCLLPKGTPSSSDRTIGLGSLQEAPHSPSHLALHKLLSIAVKYLQQPATADTSVHVGYNLMLKLLNSRFRALSSSQWVSLPRARLAASQLLLTLAHLSCGP